MDEIVDPQEHAAHGESGRRVHVDDLTIIAPWSIKRRRMQMEVMMDHETSVVKVKGLNYPIGKDGRPVRAKPWIGNVFSLLYDFAMKRSTFPRRRTIVPPC